jgi:hypothetical protein
VVLRHGVFGSDPAAAYARQRKDIGVFLSRRDQMIVASPESFRGWNVPSRSPSPRVRYDRLATGGYDLGRWTKRGTTNHTVPFLRRPPGYEGQDGTDHVCPLAAPKAFGAGYLRSSLRDKLVTRINITLTVTDLIRWEGTRNALENRAKSDIVTGIEGLYGADDEPADVTGGAEILEPWP